jgi:hypothetical protein
MAGETRTVKVAAKVPRLDLTPLDTCGSVHDSRIPRVPMARRSPGGRAIATSYGEHEPRDELRLLLQCRDGVQVEVARD